MPLYKLQEAQRAPATFGGPATMIDPNTTRSPPHLSHSQRIPPSAMPQHATRIATTHPIHPQQHQQHLQQQLLSQQQQQHQHQHQHQHQYIQRIAPKQETPLQPAHSHVEKLEHAHYGHSLYFIEHLFPSKLWRILDDAERCGYNNVISWVDNGMAFQIHDRHNVIPILEKFFNMSKFKSFLRQLQAYGFQRVASNPQDISTKPKRDSYRGKWNHPLFRRDKMNLCNKMTRDGSTKKEDKAKSATGSGKSSPEHKEIAPANPGPAGSPPSQSPTRSSAAKQGQRVNRSQNAIAQHHHQQKQKQMTAQKQLAAQQHHQAQQQQHHQAQQQQQHNQHMQLLHNQMIQHHQHHPHAPPPHQLGGAPVYHHNTQFAAPPPHHQHPKPPQYSQLPPGVHHSHQPPPRVHHQPSPGAHHPSPPGAISNRLPQTAAAPITSAATTGVAPAIMARVKQQQEEHKRQQLQMQIQNIKGQQLISTILGRSAEVPHGQAPAMAPGMAPGTAAPVAAFSTAAPAPVGNPALKGIYYNNTHSKNSLSAVSQPISPDRSKEAGKASSAATTAVSEAADELHRAELALIERRVRLAEAQQLAKNEAEAIAKAEAAVRAAQSSAAAKRAGEQPSPVLAATSTSTAAAQELMLRKYPQTVTHATSLQQAPAVAPSSDSMHSSQKAATGGLSITTLLEDLDKAFKTSAIPSPPKWAAPAIQIKDLSQSASSSKAALAASHETTLTNDQLKITDEELQRARAQAAGAPVPMDLVAQTVPKTATDNPTISAAAHASTPGKSSPAPSASEREVILARLNAMEQIRLRDQKQQKQEAERIQDKQKRSQQQQQLLTNYAKAEMEGKLPALSVPSPSANDASSTVVRDAIRNAAVGLISGDSSAATAGFLSPLIETTNPALGRFPAPSSVSGIIERINPPTSVLPPVQAPKSHPQLLSKEMMDIFAKTAAAAISSKPIDSSDSSNASPGDNSRITSPTPTSLLAGISKPTTTSSTESALAANITGKEPAPTPSQKSPLSSKKPLEPASSVISNSELEAARALMRIPGTVTQPSGQSLTGHWELVRPEGLKKGSPLAKTLPEVVNKSANISYEAYRNLALKMSPPGVMSIPDNWDARKEFVYLVIDPANTVNNSISPASAAGATMAITKTGSASAPGNPSAAVALHQAAGPATAFRAANLR